ncbi:2'-5' RNA ligase family protein [Enteractinococcus coprophilus]|uniref:2'-5' RNA ligase n=1 Tax=Enteractinococcus coprophilus TaxID=1027633 RepID=A0A543A0D2_9MICC|nr:2'-5' RNA ligase family protein [Enteractinococcus coprophilus]TQL66037.1 hypothetical protein FB556_2516 [Enteractinococcus coprophilus]
MASPDNILLHLAEDDEQQVRDVFKRLAERGFQAQQQTPHVTITFSPAMPADVVQCAAELLPPVVPASLKRVGSVVFGTKRKQTVAWLLETTDELERAARQISALNPDGRGPRWIPHLTVGLRLPREIVPEYMRALDELTSSHLKEFTAVRAAFWRPRAQELRVLAGATMNDSVLGASDLT